MKTPISRRELLAGAAALMTTGPVAAQMTSVPVEEPPFLVAAIASGKLPPLPDRLPRTPLIADMIDRGRRFGQYGGDLRTLIAKPRDLRYFTVMGYTRLMGYDEYLNLEPDILEAVENDGGRVITFTLREGHRWSDGAPFTTEDFRFYWEDVALNRELRPAGPPAFMIVGGHLPKVEILDVRRVRFSWPRPNPRFLPSLAGPRPDWIYTPAHYLKQFHRKYADPAKLSEAARQRQLGSWAAYFNKMDDPYEASNPDMPTLDPWHIVTRAPAQQFIFERNPYFHRVDPRGRQLPYIDRIVANVAASGLFATKANAGEVDLLFRGITTGDIPMLKEGEASHHYRTLAWPIARGSAFALYPNLTCNDRVWRPLLRDVRFRRALSLSIDRHTLNNALWFRLGIEGNNTVLPASALYSTEDHKAWANYDPDLANRLLDEIGLTAKDPTGIRMLPDGRLAELIVEVAGDASDIIDAMQITGEFWLEIGIKMVIKPEDPSDLSQRAYAGQTVMMAAQGLDNAIPTAEMPPTELAPLRQDVMAWPKWGQYIETAGKSGERPDMPEARELLALYDDWMNADTLNEKTTAWRSMLSLHAEQQFIIGTVQGALQPIVASRTLQNIPKKAIFSWEPTANLGIYRPDEFFLEQKTAQAAPSP